jgi:hypothetical protein
MSDPFQLPSDWWTVRDTADYLAVSEGNVRTYVSRGEIPAPDRQIGRSNLRKPRTIITGTNRGQDHANDPAGSRRIRVRGEQRQQIDLDRLARALF